MSKRATPRAPTADGAVVAVPPLLAVGELLTNNRQKLRREGRLLDRRWSELRQEARLATVTAARKYLQERGEPVPAFDATGLILAGHQPELFHPGVWVKNFALNGLARKHGLTPLNLIVDNDTVKAAALRLPAPPNVTHPWPHVVSLPFDRWTGEIPYEEHRIQDSLFFNEFADRASAVLQGWDFEPMLPAFWQEVRRAASRGPLLGDSFAAARRTFERRWNCHNLEVPVSAICRTEPFAWFACHLLCDLPRFQNVYNDRVHQNRIAHGIRSRNHPVPDLIQEDGWYETPFWGWQAGQVRRGRLFARIASGQIELRAGIDTWPTLPGSSNSRSLLAAWQSLELRGYKVRSRALTNTLYARLFLADLFIHGIGGGKYDELTDEIIRHFYGVEPTEFLVLSATRLLPLPIEPVQLEDRQRLARLVRDIHWNPQRHLDLASIPSLRAVYDEKQEWMRRQLAEAAGRRQRFAMLRSLTERLHEPLQDKERQLREKLARYEKQLEANAVLRRRDYSFCLYPEETLREFCTRFL